MIAITGASGFLGRHISKTLTPNVPVPRPARTDLWAWKRWLNNTAPSVVIHCAGLADVRRSITDPGGAFRANAAETFTLLEGLEGRKILLVYVATDKVFGDQQDCDLFTPYHPLNSYDASKVSAEYAVLDFQKRNPCVIARFPNFFGNDDPHPERLIPSIMLAMCSGDRQFRVRTNPDATRQYIWINDAVRCIRHVISEPTAAPVHHFAPQIIKSVRQVVNDLGEIFHHQMDLVTMNLPGEANQLSLKNCTPLDIAYTNWETALDCFKLVTIQQS